MLTLNWAPLAGGAPSPLYTWDLTSVHNVVPGSLATVGGAAYFLADATGTSGGTTTLMTSTAGAMATTVTSYAMEGGPQGCGLVADANGFYEFVNGDSGGIYKADPTTGAQTLIESPLNLNTQVHALDAKNIYYATVGGSQWALYAHPR